MKYDQTLFSGTAEYYAKYRPKYPKQLFDKIIQTFASDHDDILLDLGCGTGAISLPLAKYFGQVLAWDPDADMLQQAQKAAKRQNTENIIFEQKSSDNLPSIDTKIKLVTMGQSLHWMDGARKQLGTKATAFDQELTKKLQALAPDGIFQERVIFSLITAKNKKEIAGSAR